MVDDKKVAWNASQGLIMEISNRRVSANTHFINGDIRKAFNTLIAIKQSVIQSFNSTQRNELDAIEKKFLQIANVISSSARNSFNYRIRKAYSDAHSLASSVYSAYNEKLMDLLDKYGYLISELSDSSKMRF
jgi:hypothetical protein